MMVADFLCIVFIGQDLVVNAHIDATVDIQILMGLIPYVVGICRVYISTCSASCIRFLLVGV